jgi:hypothetical protein
MVAVSIRAFGGMVPALDDRLISDQAATYSVNGYLYSGKLIGLPSPKILRA